MTEDQITNIVMGILGFIGLSGVIAAIRQSRRLSRHHRFFRFQASEPLDIVLTTSTRAEGGYAGISYVRTTTAVGNLKGATEIAQAVGYRSPRRPISVAVSAELESRLNGDLVLLGLPGKNAATALVIQHLQDRHPELRLGIQESTEEGSSLSLGEFVAPYEVCTQLESEVPQDDFALVVLWVNPLAVRKRRLILCAGFTAYGTGAAAKYLVDEILATRYRHLRRSFSDLPPLWRKPWPCFAMIVQTRLINDQVAEVVECAFAPIPDPGTPPFEGVLGTTPARVRPIDRPAGPPAAP